MASRIDPIQDTFRLTGPMRIRPLAEAPAVARGPADVDTRASARLDSFQFSSPTRTTLPTAPAPQSATRMVAATVPGRVDFFADSTEAAPASPALPMYRHPADRNAAATAVNAGRVLDVEG